MMVSILREDVRTMSGLMEDDPLLLIKDGVGYGFVLARAAIAHISIPIYAVVRLDQLPAKSRRDFVQHIASWGTWIPEDFAGAWWKLIDEKGTYPTGELALNDPPLWLEEKAQALAGPEPGEGGE
jgi:hypothetical protein